MLFALGLIMLSLYIAACVGVEIITKDADLRENPETAAIVNFYFSNLGRTVLTLIQFITMDGTASFYGPLIHVKPGLVIYFATIILFVTIALMNLVTATLVAMLEVI